MTTDLAEFVRFLRSALCCGGEVWVGKKGQVHGQIPRQSGTVTAGFVDIRERRFMTRAEAAQRLGIPGLDSLHSQILERLQREWEIVSPESPNLRQVR